MIKIKSLKQKQSLILRHGARSLFHFAVNVQLLTTFDVCHRQHLVPFFDLVPQIPIGDMLGSVEKGSLLNIFGDGSPEIVLEVIHVHALIPKKATALDLMDGDRVHAVVGNSKV